MSHYYYELICEMSVQEAANLPNSWKIIAMSGKLTSTSKKLKKVSLSKKITLQLVHFEDLKDDEIFPIFKMCSSIKSFRTRSIASDIVSDVRHSFNNADAANMLKISIAIHEVECAGKENESHD